MKPGIRHIDFAYPGQPIFRDFSLDFRENTITCILGPSGCGKTTLLNILSGNLQPDRGERTGFADKRLSYIFQEPRLLPWKTVAGNLLFPVRDQVPLAEEKDWLDHYLRLVSLQGKDRLYPRELSGGMKQRVSIARAFACPSDIILMDEAFRALDLPLKNNLMESFLRLWTEHRRTVIAVTHDLDEALALGQELIVFSRSPVRIIDRIRMDEEEGKAGGLDLSGIRRRLISGLTEAGNGEQEHA